MILRAVSLAAGAALLFGCAQQPRPQQNFRQALQNSPGNAQPSLIVAREIEMLKRARDIGQLAASAEFAVAQAQVISRTGVISGAQLPTMEDDSRIAPWQPKTVWMSCDGRFAISDGRFETAEGLVGDYLTSWVRDRASGEYRWLHNAAALDDPQPPPKPASLAPQPGEIVVDGLIAVDGHVADCASKPSAIPAASGPWTEFRSPDRTLVWRWAYEGGNRMFQLDAWTEGEWTRVIDTSWSGEVSQ